MENIKFEIIFNNNNLDQDNIINDNLLFIKNIIIKKNNTNILKYISEILLVSDLDNALLYYKNINVIEYIFTVIYFNENLNLGEHYSFSEKLNLIIKTISLVLSDNIINDCEYTNKVFIIFKSISDRLNKI